VNADMGAMGALLAVPTSRVSDHVRQLTGEHRPSASPVVIQGPGGTGKTLLLAELATAYRRAGLTVVDGGSVPDPAALSGDLAVLVDDGQRLTAEGAGRLRRWMRHPGARVTVAFRPWPRPAPLREVIEELGSDRRSVVLGHVDRNLVQSWAREQLGDAATPGLIDVVLQQTGGLPALIHPLLRSLAGRVLRRRPGEVPGRPAGGHPGGLPIPDDVVDLVRTGLTRLDDETRILLHAVSAGAPPDADVLADLLALPTDRTVELVSQGRATGLLLPNGQVIPLVRGLLLATTPAEVTRAARRRLLDLLLDRGEEPLDLARLLAATGVRDPRAAQLLERHGSAALKVDPVLADRLFDEATATGASTAGLAARRAQAAALSGDFDAALQWADSVLTDEAGTDRARAAGVTAAVMARRGLLVRSAELYRLAGPDRAGSAALALLATGSAGEAAAVLDDATRMAGEAPTIVSGSEGLMARGILQSLRSGEDAEADIAASLSTLTRAAALLEPVGRTALLLDTPASLAALVALQCGELGVAESVLHRAVRAEVGGPPSLPRHLLLLAWAAMLRGREAQARDDMARAQREAGDVMEPRDELFLQALEVGLARRSGDLPTLGAAWGRAREALLRHPIELFALLPLGELMIAGARLRDADRLRTHLAEAQALLARLDHPQLWSTPLHWSAAQAAILTDDPAALRPHAAALVAAARTSPYAATLAQAGRCWLRVLTDDVDPAAVEVAAHDLASVGLAWDGSRLAAQAAVRAVDARARTALLSCARTLTDGLHCDAAGYGEHAVADVPATQALLPVGKLSDREREVARLVVAGQTYREIGGRLFISSKTVEHHVSRMRQRLGASNRSDLLARLRAELEGV
jgi:DNA-binding CsgD family transcriptional regulator